MPLEIPSWFGTGLSRLAPLIAAGAIVALWQGACVHFSLPEYVLPSPGAILAAGLRVSPGDWLGHVGATLRVALMGYALAIAISLPLAVALSLSRLLSRTIYPLLIVVQSTPVVAIAPIIVVVLGVGDLPRVAITCMIAFFPMVVSTATGLLATPSELIELSRSLRAGRRREVLDIRLPFAVPYMFSAF